MKKNVSILTVLALLATTLVADQVYDETTGYVTLNAADKWQQTGAYAISHPTPTVRMLRAPRGCRLGEVQTVASGGRMDYIVEIWRQPLTILLK